MSWKMRDNKGDYVQPLKYSSGKDQLDISEEILSALKTEDIVILKGGVGTGKSAIVLNVSAHFDKSAIVVPVKVLQNQYVDDYLTGKYHFLNRYGEIINIENVKGKSNYYCPFLGPGETCGSKRAPCSRKIEKYESRLRVAKDCPYWSPVFQSKFVALEKVANSLPDREIIPYNSISGDRLYFMSPDPCDYYKTFHSFTQDGIIVFNSEKWNIETFIGRKPVFDLEVIDEGDDFLDSLSYSVTVNSRTVDSIEREGLVPDDVLRKISHELKNVLKNRDDYEGYLTDDSVVYEFVKYFVDEIGGVSTSGSVCDKVNKIKLIMNNERDAYAKIQRGNLTVYIPRPDITLKEIQKRSGKLVLMSATVQGDNVLRKVFGISPKIIDAEEVFPGTLYLAPHGQEQTVTNTTWNTDGFQKEYNELLTFILKNALRPCLVQVHAEKYVPAKYMKYKNEWKDGVMFSTVTDRGIDLPYDECRCIVIMKYPIPNIDTPVFRTMRKNFGESTFWYYLNDIADRNLVQQCGRAIRALDDWCEVITLDRKVLTRLPKLWKGNLVIRDIYSRIHNEKTVGEMI